MEYYCEQIGNGYIFKDKDGETIYVKNTQELITRITEDFHEQMADLSRCNWNKKFTITFNVEISK